MDAFFVGVELVHRPELRGRPVVVGGTGARGVVAAASYEARAYGVHSAMPTARARRLCPDAVFLDGRHDLYAEASRSVFEIFRSFTPLVEGLSLDEAFLDVTHAGRLFGGPMAIARSIRERTLHELSLSCSVGLAPNKFLAKLASEAAKPTATPSGPQGGAGVFVVEPGCELDFLHPLPIRSLWGVGPATADKLQRKGIRTIGDIAALPEDAIVASVGRAHGRHLHQLARGLDDREVEPHQPAVSISHEETFAVDVFDRGHLDRELVRMADGVSRRLRAANLEGRTISIKVRFGSFATITRARTVAAATSLTSDIVQVSRALLDEVAIDQGVRLLGVAMSQLAAPGPKQLSLLDAGPREAGAEPTDDARESAASAVDEIRSRFGDAAIGPATLAGRHGVEVKRPGEQQWGPPSRPRDAPD